MIKVIGKAFDVLEMLSGDPARPRGLGEIARQLRFHPATCANIMQALVSCSLFPSIKHILKTQGVDCGGCRKPFPTLTEAQKAYIERVVRENM